MTQAGEPGRQLPHARLVTDQRNTRVAGLFGEIGRQRLVREARGERLDHDEGGRREETAGNDFCGLPRPHEWTGHHHVERHVESRQATGGLAQPRDPLTRERAFRIVGPRVAALLGAPVSNEIELVGGRHQ